MGLVDFREKMSATTVNSNSSTSTTRRKRAFDIAFLTGQNETTAKEDSSGLLNNNNNVVKEKRRLSSPVSSPASSSSTTFNSTGVDDEEDERSSNNHSNCSSIDIMTTNIDSDDQNPPEPSKLVKKGSKDKLSISDHMKIKENLNQFSTMFLPSSTSSRIPTGSNFYHQSHHPTDLSSLAASTFALIPHMSKFGPTGMGMCGPFVPKSEHGSLVKSSGHLSHQPNNNPPTYAFAGYSFPPQMMGRINSNQELRNGRPISQQQQMSPPMNHAAAAAAAAALINPPSLLPPSLTALTLPAQNVCAKCNIGFRMTSDLVYHMRSHHRKDELDPLKKKRDEKLRCPVCHETFRER